MIIKLLWKIPRRPHHAATGAVVQGVHPPTGVVAVEVLAKIKVVPTSQITPKDKNHHQTRYTKPEERFGTLNKRSLTPGQVPNLYQGRQYATIAHCPITLPPSVDEGKKISLMA